MTDKQKIQLADRLDFIKTYFDVFFIDFMDTAENMPVELDMAKYIRNEISKLENRIK